MRYAMWLLVLVALSLGACENGPVDGVPIYQPIGIEDAARLVLTFGRFAGA